MTPGKKFIVIFVILALLAMALLIQVFNRPLHRITSDFYHPFFSPVSKMENLTMKQALLLQSKPSLVKEMLQLQKVNEKFSSEINLLQDIKKENADLKELLVFKPTPGFKCIFAEIYLRDPALWNESFSINKGSADGIKPGCAVLCRVQKEKAAEYVFAVAGRVSAVAEHESQIETIISKNCRISVILKDSRGAGILEGGTFGNGEPSVIVTKLPVFKTYKAGETVLTSGLSRDTTPPLLYVGNVSSRNNTPNIRIVDNLYADADITPAVNFDNLRYLIVLVPKKIKPHKQ
jgi:rod shape-determining protein MreC